MDTKSQDQENNQPTQLGLFGEGIGISDIPGNIAHTPTTIEDTENEQLLISILAFASLKGIGFKTICQAFDSGFLLDVWVETNDLHLHPFLKGKDNPDLLDLAPDNLKEMAKPQLENLCENKVSFIALGHPEYPQALMKLKEPPRWLFVKGNTQLLSLNSIVGVVGTREPSQEGESLAYDISACLTRQDIVVLSGLAKGIDAAAHKGCLDYFGQTIGILGHGINFHRLSHDTDALIHRVIQHGGAVASEYLPNDPPSTRSFLRRNEIQAALSRSIIPVECPSPHSGTAATVRRAKSLNVPVVGLLKQSPAFDATRETLTLLEAEIQAVADDSLEETLIENLTRFLPEHHWDQGTHARQDRFFHLLIRFILGYSNRIELDETSVDRLAEMLKSHLGESSK